MASSVAPPLHQDPHLDVIFINLHSSSDFRIFRARSSGTLAEELTRINRHVDDGCYTIVSLNASEHSCVTVLTTELSKAQLREKGFPFTKD